MRRCLASRERISKRAIEIRRRLLVRTTPRDDQLADKFVEWQIRCQAITDPGVERIDAADIEEVLFGTQQVGPLQAQWSANSGRANKRSTQFAQRFTGGV